MFKNRKSFTLVELLMVIAIIGILSAVVVVNLSSARTKAKDSRVKSDVLQAAPSVEAYFGGNYDKSDLDCGPNGTFLQSGKNLRPCNDSYFVNSTDVRLKTIGKLATDVFTAGGLGSGLSIFSYGTGYFISSDLPSSRDTKSFFVDSKANTGIWSTPQSAMEIISNIFMANAQAKAYFNGTYNTNLICNYSITPQCHTWASDTDKYKKQIGIFADNIIDRLDWQSPPGSGQYVGMYIRSNTTGYKIYAPLASRTWSDGIFCIDSTGKYYKGLLPADFSWFSVTCP